MPESVLNLFFAEVGLILHKGEISGEEACRKTRAEISDFGVGIKIQDLNVRRVVIPPREEDRKAAGYTGGGNPPLLRIGHQVGGVGDEAEGHYDALPAGDGALAEELSEDEQEDGRSDHHGIVDHRNAGYV